MLNLVGALPAAKYVVFFPFDVNWDSLDMNDALHPQWVVVDLQSEKSVNAVRISWQNPYATRYQVEYWEGTGALDFDAGPKGEWKVFSAGAFSNAQGGTVTLKLTDAPVSTRYLRVLANQFNGDMVKMVAAYNAGPDAVKKCGGTVPSFPETQDYVTTVLQLYAYLKPAAALGRGGKAPGRIHMEMIVPKGGAAFRGSGKRLCRSRFGSAGSTRLSQCAEHPELSQHLPGARYDL